MSLSTEEKAKILALFRHEDHENLEMGLMLLGSFLNTEQDLRDFFGYKEQESCQEKAIEQACQNLGLDKSRSSYINIWILGILAQLKVKWVMEHTRVYFHNHELTRIPQEIGHLSNLVSLNLSSNKLQFLPAEIGNLHNLKHLNLERNELTIPPSEIGNLSALTDLELHFNKLQSLPAEIGKLDKLERLDLRFNPIATLPKDIRALKLGSRQWTRLYKDVCRIRSLRRLDLSSNYNITTLPKEIGNLIGLTHLNLNFNKLQSLPAEIGNLNNLVSLELEYNELQSLPAEIGNLNNLVSLSCERNQLQSLPSSITKLKNLQTFNLRANPLYSFPAGLVALEIDRHQMKKLGTQLYEMTSLRYLNLRDNRLLKVPDELEQLVELIGLDISGNYLRHLPSAIPKLPHLQKVDFYCNSYPSWWVKCVEWIVPCLGPAFYTRMPDSEGRRMYDILAKNASWELYSYSDRLSRRNDKTEEDQ